VIVCLDSIINQFLTVGLKGLKSLYCHLIVMDTKQIQISGGAAAEYSKGGGTRRKQRGSGLSNSPPGNALSFAKKSDVIPVDPFHGGKRKEVAAKEVAAKEVAAKEVAAKEVAPVASSVPAQQKSKLLLVPSRKKAKSSVILAPAKGRAPLKTTRKIRVHLSSMKKRLTQAKTIHGNSRDKPIEEIRRILEEAKLVKPKTDGKKVPDNVLRDIYKDYMLLRTKVL
jgi:hypothetical protein